jgi:hypothetical protein
MSKSPYRFHDRGRGPLATIVVTKGATAVGEFRRSRGLWFAVDRAGRALGRGEKSLLAAAARVERKRP